MVSRTSWLSSIVGACATLVAVDAWASPSARLVYLRNPGTEACPDENAVRSAVAVRLGYDPFFPSASQTMFIELSPDKGGYRARIKLVDEKNDVRGTREIAEKGRSCSAMIDTLALSISIAIDPDSLTRPPAPTAEEDAEPAAPQPDGPTESPTTSTTGKEAAEPTEPVPPSEPATSPPLASATTERSSSVPVSPSAVRVEVLALPAVWIGTGPTVAIGGEIGARLKWPHVSVGLEARGDLPASRSVEGVDVEMTFFGGSLVGCGHSSVFFACARATVGSISATSNVAMPRDASALRLLLGTSAGVELPVGQAFHIVARWTGNLATDRHTIVLNDVNAFELPTFSGGLEIGGLVRF